jgi:uncharacterized membrane protein
MMGPVQVLVVGFDHPVFSGEVIAEFTQLREAGIVRLVDLLLVSRAEDGTLDTVSMPEIAPSGLGEIAAALFTREGLDVPLSEPDTNGEADGDATWSLAAAVPAGSAAAVALVEHIWAEPLTRALRRAGGRPLEETWLGRDDRQLLAALEERRRAAQG